MANGWGTGRVEKQLLRYCDAIADEDAWAAFGVRDDTDVRVMYVFEHPRELELVQNRAVKEKTFERWQHHFFARELDAVRDEDFGEEWVSLATADGERVELFSGAAAPVML
jgi:hypothetical protein